MDRPKFQMSFAAAAAALSVMDSVRALPEIRFPRHHGPGRKTLHTYWKNVGASKYMPHFGAKQRAKVVRRTAKAESPNA